MTDRLQESDRRLTVAQRQMLADIAASGMPEGGRGWTSHSQRRLDSLVRRGLVRYSGGGRWELRDGVCIDCPHDEIERLRQDYRRELHEQAKLKSQAWAEVERLKAENLALVDAMRDARALLHKPRPRAMAAASLLGDALTTRALAMLPEEGDDDA